MNCFRGKSPALIYGRNATVLWGGLEGFRVSRNPSAQVPGAGRHTRRTASDPSRAALHVVSEQTFSLALIYGRNAIFGYNGYSYIRSK